MEVVSYDADPYEPIPEVPIRRVKRKTDPERVERAAHQLLELADREGIRGPASLMRAMEEVRELRRYLDIQTEVVRKARAIRHERERDGFGGEQMSETRTEPTKGERMEAHIRAMLREDPEASAREVYLRLPLEDRDAMKELSFANTYFYGIRGKLRRRGEVPESGTSEMSAPTQGASAPAPERDDPDPERVAPDTGELEDPWEEEPEADPEQDERSEAAPAPSSGIPSNAKTQWRIVEEEGRGLRLVGSAGEVEAREVEDDLWELRVDVLVPQDSVDQIAGHLYPILLGLSEPPVVEGGEG